MVAPINNSGNSAYGVGFTRQNNGNEVEEKEKNKQQGAAEQRAPQAQVNPDDVFAFLANNGVYVPVVTDTNNDGIINELDVDAETQERIDQFMAKFDVVYKLIEDEFGAELAPRLVDMVMDKVMGF